MTMAASEPPRIGDRWCTTVIGIDSEYPAYDEIVHDGGSRIYVSTPVVSIQRLTFDQVLRATQ
ncbi:hypothetical protein [Cryobacterium glucosi]|uniref:Uncharacterized protein n=1 Tax=Cryobacterium glucosi TaxID=1259175 RepID=A0ABY2IHP2_9MICO|nr:hypothetical protein [Cryobacterium glucosi]TFC16544.1 hypothetical protein E3O46_17995 [Cryobacterium glucosi]